MALRFSNASAERKLAEMQAERQRQCDRQSLSFEDYSVGCLQHGRDVAANRPIAIPEYAHKARLLRYGIWAAAFIAIVVFGILNAISLSGGSQVAIFAGSVMFAVLMGMVANVVVAWIVRVDSGNPKSCARANGMLVAGGLSWLISFSVFLYLRFSESESAREALPAIAMMYELGLLVFVAAACELWKVYEWPGRLAKEWDEAKRDIQAIDRTIAACNARLIRKGDNIDEEANEVSGGLRVYGPDGGSRDCQFKANGAASGHSGND